MTVGRSGEAKAKSPVKLARRVPTLTRLRLAASSAGRCEFRGCNRNLYQHAVTSDPGNFAEAAHIVAFRPDGPRGRRERPVEVNGFDNLMLLCPECHILIDSRSGDFPVAELRMQKREHEERILALTASGPEMRTTVIQLRGRIGGQPVDIPAVDIRTALQPRYPASVPGLLIDLSAIEQESAGFFEIARDQIRRELRTTLRAAHAGTPVQHYSVFALAPIPVLVCLGRALGNKITVDVFQRQRDQSWCWREEPASVEYDFRRLREGSDPMAVALQLSLSSAIVEGALPTDIDGRFSIYELTLEGRIPNVEIVRSRNDLLHFRRVYRDAIEHVAKRHPGLEELHFFAAVPAPVAVACGQEVMPKAHPALVVYDNVRGRFQRAICVNSGEDL